MTPKKEKKELVFEKGNLPEGFQALPLSLSLLECH